MSADFAGHLPGHTLIDPHDGMVLLNYRRPARSGKPDEFVRLLYSPAAARDLAAEIIRVAEEVAP